MKRVIFALLILCLPLCALAQGERDFATQYMALYAEKDASLTCQTVSPEMMTQMLRSESVQNDDETKNIIRHIRTLQVVSATGEDVAEHNYERALNLAQLNAKRYNLYAYSDTHRIYCRKKGNTIVELVHISCTQNTFRIINLTGNMTWSFLEILSH
jgi:hypothetical protein